jgi:HD-like signal output (HDOD) protein
MSSATGVELRDELVAQATAIPLGNQHALLEVARLCGSPVSRAQDVAVAAAHDEAFAALLLRVANSAHSGSTTRISSLPAAVTRLGFRLVQGLALAAPGLGLLVSTHDAFTAQRRVLHQHAVRTGIVARKLARTQEEADRALAAGLVHNLGLTILSVYATDHFTALVSAAAARKQLRCIEEDLLGFTHAELGGRVGTAWGYPPELVTAILEHDQEHPATALASLVQCADLLVREVGPALEPPRRLPTPSFAELGIDVGRSRDEVSLLLDTEDRHEAEEADDEEEEAAADQASGKPLDAADVVTTLNDLI